MHTCPVCSGTEFSLLASSSQLAEECRVRERFIKERLARPASPDELKDLTDFLHGEKAEILACATCCLLVRRELEPPPAETYSEDEYDATVMERLYPQYVEVFRRKEHPYRNLLPGNARVIEVGSHYGAFLQTAQEWGWQAAGVDVGQTPAASHNREALRFTARAFRVPLRSSDLRCSFYLELLRAA